MNHTANSVSFHRNHGIDLLRLIAAFYVIILHTLNHGGIYRFTTPHSYQELLCRILLIVSFGAVNIFGIISGYVGYREPQKRISYSGYLPLWLTVVFYCVLFAGFYLLVLPDVVTRKDLISAFFPVSTDLYWYFSAYTAVYFFAPFLNRILYYSSEKELRMLFLLICCAMVPMEYVSDAFALNGGYSAIWLILLYLVGGIMKKTGIGNNISSGAVLFFIIIMDIFFFWIGLERTELTVFLYTFSLDVRYSYVTPFYLVIAIAHVILFSKLKFRPFSQKIIRFAAPAAFSVYIVNTNPFFWDYYMFNRFMSWATSSPAGILVRTVAFSLAFVCVVIIFDFFRQQLFRLLDVNNWSCKLSVFFHKDKAS